MLAPEGISEICDDPFYRQEYRGTEKLKVVKAIQSRPHRWSLVKMILE